MEKELLEACLAKGMSLEAIGEMVGKHPTTVSYWLKKYGLAASKAKRHAPKGRVERKSLETLIGEGLTLREIANRLDRGTTTIRYWLAKYGLTTIRRKRSREAGDPPKMEMLCRRHGRTEFTLEGRGYYRCARCRVEAVSKRRRLVKQTLVEEREGAALYADTAGACRPSTSIILMRELRPSSLDSKGTRGRLIGLARRQGSAPSYARTVMPRWRQDWPRCR